MRLAPGVPNPVREGSGPQPQPVFRTIGARKAWQGRFQDVETAILAVAWPSGQGPDVALKGNGGAQLETASFPVARELETGIDPRYLVIVSNSRLIGNAIVSR